MLSVVVPLSSLERITNSDMTDDTESDSPFSSLTPLQAQVATALAHGSSITAAALASGLHRVTIHRWLKNNTAFYTAVDQGTTEYALALRDDLRELSERALQTLSRVLDDPTASPSVLVKTAMFILQRPQFPKPGWSLPVSCLEPGACEWPADSPLLACSVFATSATARSRSGFDTPRISSPKAMFSATVMFG